jgi:hypothetical protein
MPDLSDLVGGPPAAAGGRQVLRGRVARAPGSLGDSMEVLVPGFSGVLSYAVPAQNWTARGSALPAAGASCLVVLDSDNDAFVPVYDSGPDPGAGLVWVGPDAPADGESLWIDTDEVAASGQTFVPLGGLSGQYLTKLSNADGDVGWKTLDRGTIVGRWAATNTAVAAPVAYNFGVAANRLLLSSAAQAYMVEQGDNVSIKLLKAGVYRVNLEVLTTSSVANQRQDVNLRKNNTIVRESLGYTQGAAVAAYVHHTIDFVDSFAVNDLVAAWAGGSSSGYTTYADSGGIYTHLQIVYQGPYQ